VQAPLFFSSFPSSKGNPSVSKRSFFPLKQRYSDSSLSRLHFFPPLFPFSLFSEDQHWENESSPPPLFYLNPSTSDKGRPPFFPLFPFLRATRLTKKPLQSLLLFFSFFLLAGDKGQMALFFFFFPVASGAKAANLFFPSFSFSSFPTARGLLLSPPFEDLRNLFFFCS